MKNWHKIILFLTFALILVACALSGSGDGKPDLIIDNYVITYDDCPWEGPGQVAVRVKNIGNADAGQFATEINGDESAVTTQLAAGAETDAVVTFTAGPIGGITAAADIKQQIDESNEDNNNYQISFTPPPPCITPTP